MENLMIPWVHLTELNSLNFIDPCSHGIYREYGRIIVDHCRPWKVDIIGKNLHRLFNNFGFKLDIHSHVKITDYLDVNFTLNKSTVAPFRKHSQVQSYIDAGSNHPKAAFKHIPNGIIVTLSTNFSNLNIFTENKHEYK